MSFKRSFPPSLFSGGALAGVRGLVAASAKIAELCLVPTHANLSIR